MRRRGAEGETRFLTFGCIGGRRLLAGRAAKTVIVDALRELVEADAIVMHAWVIMGNHLHLLVTPRAAALEDSLAILKTRAAQAIGSAAAEPHQVWERGGGFDRLIWSDRAYWNVFSYIHMNPVKAGLAATPVDWQWSSARDWARPRRNTPAVRHPTWVEL
jgi:putative transposase